MSQTRRRSIFGGIAIGFVAIALTTPQSAHAQTDPPAEQLQVDQITLVDGKPVGRTTTAVTPQVTQFRAAAKYAAATPAKAVVSARLRDRLAASSTGRVTVTVTLREDQKIPQFPSLVTSEAPDSAHNLAARASAAQLISTLRATRAADYTAWRARVAALGGTVRQDYWLVKGFTADLPLAAITELANDPQVQYIEPSGGVAVTADSDAGNDMVVARTLLGTEPYRSLARSTDRIALIDSGVNSHVLNNGVIGNTFDETGEFPLTIADQCDHGTRSVAALAGNSSLTDQFRGITSMKVNVYKWIVGGSTAACLNGDSANVVTAIQGAVANLEKVLVLPLGSQEGPDSSMSVEADNAFDAGAVVIAASGNNGTGAGTVSAPGNARKVIAVGAVDVKTFALQSYVGQGPTSDGRFKPDVVAPTNYETASSASTTATGIYTGTSAASTAAGGTAADLWTFLRGNSPTVNPGFVYSGLIAGGGHPYVFGNDEGAGKLKLSAGGVYNTVAVTVTDGQEISVPIALNQPGCRVTASLWWPEQAGTHNDIDLQLVDPSGTAASSTSSRSVFELARAASATAGTWKVKVKGFRVLSGSQTVFATLTTCR
jgi:hypothetical protein